MCGINVFISKNGDISNNDHKVLTQGIRHRGPDAEDSVLHGGVYLGHSRLAILDLSDSANQPLVSSCGNYVLVFNGEIFNYRDLAVLLNLNQEYKSDSALLLDAFISLGPKVLNYLNGFFAFAVHNKVTNKTFIARDRLGIKPLYYSLAKIRLFLVVRLSR